MPFDHVAVEGELRTRPGDPVKTDKRDARRLVALRSGGLLTAIVRASGAVDASNQMAETHG